MGPLPNGRTSWLIIGGDPITTYPSPGSPSSKYLGSWDMVYISGQIHLERVPQPSITRPTPSLGDKNDHYGNLTTYPSPGMIPLIFPNLPPIFPNGILREHPRVPPPRRNKGHLHLLDLGHADAFDFWTRDQRESGVKTSAFGERLRLQLLGKNG